jgi:hypothetical protein
MTSYDQELDGADETFAFKLSLDRRRCQALLD